MMYRQITREERYTLAVLRQAGLSAAAIARALGRHRSTIGREVRRNRAASDASYRPQLADWYARGRRSRSRRNRRFGPAAWGRIQALLREDWSPEQVAGWLRRHGELGISHETIYRFYLGGPARGRDALSAPARRPEAPAQALWGYDSRGRLAGKRPITARPAVVETRATIGPWEGDTVLGRPSRPLRHEPGGTQDRVSRARKVAAARHGRRHGAHHTAPAGPAARFYFATPHHAWERGTNENTNGLLRQYLPKRGSMKHLTQSDCTRLAAKLNRRPRKRLGYRTPEECYVR